MRDRRPQIIAEWEREVRALPRARTLDRPALVDHLPELLALIAQLTDRAHEPEQQQLPRAAAERHALHRLDESFDLADVIAELRLLRQAILRVVRAAGVGLVDVADMAVLDAAIDATIGASVEHFIAVRDRVLQGLDRIATAVVESQDLDGLLARLLRVLQETTPAIDFAAILLREGDLLRTRASVGVGGAEREVPFGGGFAGTIAARREPMLARDPAGDDALTVLYGVPLIHAGDVIGVATIGSRCAERFSHQDQRNLAAMVARAESAIIQQVLREQADRTMAQLVVREKQFRALADHMPPQAWMADASGSMYWYSERWLQYTGLPFEEALGEGWRVAHHPADVDQVADKFHRAIAAGETWEDTFRLRSKTGSYRWFLSRAVPIRDAAGQIERWFGTNTDITDTRLLDRATAVLSQSLDYEVTLEQLAWCAVPDLADWCIVDLVEADQVRRVAVAHADPGKLELARAYARTYPPKLTANNAVAVALRAGEPRLIRELTDEVIAANALSEGQYRALVELGPRSWMIAPLVARGRTLGAIGFVMTTSGRYYEAADLAVAVELGKRAGIAVDNARLHAEAQAAVRMREDVLAIVSHDLRNPLGAIDLATTMLLQDAHGETVARKRLEAIRRASDRMVHMITDLLDMASINAGKLALQPQHEDIASIVRDAVDAHEGLAAERGISILREVVLDDVDVYCDRNRIAQALGNLLGNAIKFCRPGDVITVRGSRIGDRVRLAVTDTGPGVAAAVLPHIFDPYFAAGRERKGGTGLGLFITKGIVDAHRGMLTVHSAEGEGATFQIELPVAPADSIVISHPHG